MHPLDNIIWQALTTRQAAFSVGSDKARRFIPEIGPLAAFADPENPSYESLAGLVEPEGTLGIFLSQPYSDQRGWAHLGGAPLLQMVCANAIPPDTARASNLRILELGPPDSQEMVEPAALTKPGPFSTRTCELGLYLGIRDGGKLVAMAGERMKVPGYTEVSAVCTHPDHLGKGYAQTLMWEVMEVIRKRGERPFLHSRADNERAIGIYRKVGFEECWRGYFAVLRRL